jgi:ATP phosphoribosyltransferase
VINIALPKGRLGDKAYSIFKVSGFECPELEEDTRKLVFENKEAGVRFFLVKPWDVSIYVEHGAADIGIAGSDTILETNADIYELLDLGLGKCKMAVAGPKGALDTSSQTLVVATKYLNITKNYFSSKNLRAEIIKLNGSIELAPILGLSNIIVDIVETGATLAENNLFVLEDIMPISARLIANKSSYKFKKNNINNICAELKGYLDANN